MQTWMKKPLDEWSIVGMNHYHVNGEKRLFVSMTKEGRCIQEEGKDDELLWKRLWHKANKSEAQLSVIEKACALAHNARKQTQGNMLPDERELYEAVLEFEKS